MNRNLYMPDSTGTHVILSKAHVNVGQRTGLSFTTSAAPNSPDGGLSGVSLISPLIQQATFTRCGAATAEMCTIAPRQSGRDLDNAETGQQPPRGQQHFHVGSGRLERKPRLYLVRHRYGWRPK